MDYAIQLAGPGGPETLRRVEWPPADPGPGEIRLRHEAIGLNFLDVYHRTGFYPLPAPAIPGAEGAGRIEAIGAGVEGLSIGQHVAYAGVPGAYATTRLLPAWRAAPLPASVSAHTAAASLLRGLTVHMLVTRTHAIAPGSVVLVHAAAGGLGVILTRWIKRLGGTVIGTVGTDEKADLARHHGADHVIVGREADIVAEVGRLTGGQGCDFAVDGIGGATLAKTLRCVRRFGTVASIGQAAGPIPPVPVEDIGPIRSLTFARPSVMAYAAERETYPDAARAVLGLIEAGIHAASGPEYPLTAAAEAHADLEAGRILGSAVLLP